MGVIIKGTDDTVKAADGSLSIEGFSIKTTGIGTFDGGVQVGSAATIHSTGQFNIGVAATIFASGNATFAGIVTTAQLGGDVLIEDKIVHAGDTNTAIRFPSADTVTMETGGSERIRIRADGRISIASSLAVTGVCTAAAFVPSEGQISNRNIIINGDMNIAQRATSSTTSGYGDVDRWQHEYASTDEAPTFAQVDVTSGDAPYLVGLTRAAKITNGNQTSGLQAASQINFMQPIEAQDIRNCGWNYKSSSSYITLSYWVRASVAQEYHGFVKTADGSNYVYPFSLGSLSANTWTKITKTIPGNSNLQIDNDNGAGFQVWPVAFYGTDYTNDSITENAWAAWASGNRSTDQTSTWWTTNDSTFELTGVQLEVGSYATPFEHRSYADELRRCRRYFQKIKGGDGDYTGFSGYSESTSAARFPVRFEPPMRADMTMTIGGTFRFQGGTNDSATFTSGLALQSINETFDGASMQVTGTSSLGAADRPGNLQFKASSSSLSFDAEL